MFERSTSSLRQAEFSVPLVRVWSQKGQCQVQSMTHACARRTGSDNNMGSERLTARLSRTS